jgi:hypothetical protein
MNPLKMRILCLLFVAHISLLSCTIQPPGRTRLQRRVQLPNPLRKLLLR